MSNNTDRNGPSSIRPSRRAVVALAPLLLAAAACDGPGAEVDEGAKLPALTSEATTRWTAPAQPAAEARAGGGEVEARTSALTAAQCQAFELTYLVQTPQLVPLARPHIYGTACWDGASAWIVGSPTNTVELFNGTTLTFHIVNVEGPKVTSVLRLQAPGGFVWIIGETSLTPAGAWTPWQFAGV